MVSYTTRCHQSSHMGVVSMPLSLVDDASDDDVADDGPGKLVEILGVLNPTSRI